jgi:hypothetical protein
MFKINDVVFWARYERKERWIKCPECMGKKFLTVIMGDDSQVTIDCVGCVGGQYEGPRGVIVTYDYEGYVTKTKIDGMEIGQEKTKYKSSICSGEGYSSYYTLETEDIFLTEAEAIARTVELTAQADIKESKRLTQKHDRNRTWAWNAHYHRDRLRQANKDLIYHTAQLERAKYHVKDEKVKPQ